MWCVSSFFRLILAHLMLFELWPIFTSVLFCSSVFVRCWGVSGYFFLFTFCFSKRNHHHQRHDARSTCPALHPALNAAHRPDLWSWLDRDDDDEENGVVESDAGFDNRDRDPLQVVRSRVDDVVAGYDDEIDSIRPCLKLGKRWWWWWRQLLPSSFRLKFD